MPLTPIPDPPLALMQVGGDPDTIVGGVFDRRVFDGFADNYVFDIGGPATTLQGDPIVGNMVTIPDPVTA